MICIYQIKNIVNNKIYIGSTKNFKKRKSRHLKDLKNGDHHCIFLQRSYNKHGVYNFEFSILEECLECELFDKELEWIDKLNPEYNIGSVSGGDNYTKHPDKESIKSKLVKNLEKSWENPTRLPKEKNPNWRGGKTFFICPVCNREIRISGDKAKPKTCSKCRNRNGEKNPFFGKTHSEETKQKIRDTKKRNLEAKSKRDKNI